MTLSAENRALVERDFNSAEMLYLAGGGYGPIIDRLLDAARAEGSASPPPPAEGVGKEEHGSSCTDLSCAQAHTRERSPAGGLDLDALEKVATAVPAHLIHSGWHRSKNPVFGKWLVYADDGRGMGRQFIANTPAAKGYGFTDLSEHIATFDPPTVIRLIAAARLPETPEADPGAGKQLEALHNIADNLSAWSNDVANSGQPARVWRPAHKFAEEIRRALAAAEAASLLGGDDQPPETTR